MKTYQVDISSLHRRAYAMGEIMDALLLSTMVPSSLVALGGIFLWPGDIVILCGVLFWAAVTYLTLFGVRYLAERSPERFGLLPAVASAREYNDIFAPLLGNYGVFGVVVAFSLTEVLLLLLNFCVPKLSWVVWYAILTSALSIGFVISYYRRTYEVCDSITLLIKEGREDEIAVCKELAIASRASVACWRVGWAAWAVEGLIYAGLSLALWQALACGGVEWRQWWVATVAAMGVAGLRVLERLSPRWIPRGRPEAWAWGVRAVRLGVAVAACAGI